MGILVLTVILAAVSIGDQVSADVNPLIEVSAHSSYQNGLWVGNFRCEFPLRQNCALSIHFPVCQLQNEINNTCRTRAINHDNHNDNEIVVSSCAGDNATIDLTIVNMTYDYVQLYTCFDDSTLEYGWSWLKAYPVLEMNSNVTLGGEVTITCNSFIGMTLFWILPGMADDNTDIHTEPSIRDNNATTTATFTLKERHNYALFQCCIQLKDSQKTELPCSGYIFILDGTLKLASTYANYLSSDYYYMECVFRSEPVADPTYVEWLQCYSSDECTPVPSSIITTDVDHGKRTLNTTATVPTSNNYDHYICRYKTTNYTFVPVQFTTAPQIVPMKIQIVPNGNTMIVNMGCNITVYDSPTTVEMYWTKTIINQQSAGSQTITMDGHYMYKITEPDYTHYQYTLTILDYDTFSDNAIFTCHVKNTLGERDLSMDTTDGPYDMDFALANDPTDAGVKWGICTFTTFPLPPTYDIIVLSLKEIGYNITFSSNVTQEFANLSVSFPVDQTYYPIKVHCATFNRFDYDIRMASTIDVTN